MGLAVWLVGDNQLYFNIEGELKMNKQYYIRVKALDNNILNFTVFNYEVKDGFVVFYDLKNKRIERFAVSNCEIKEVA